MLSLQGTWDVKCYNHLATNNVDCITLKKKTNERRFDKVEPATSSKKLFECPQAEEYRTKKKEKGFNEKLIEIFPNEKNKKNFQREKNNNGKIFFWQ